MGRERGYQKMGRTQKLIDFKFAVSESEEGNKKKSVSG